MEIVINIPEWKYKSICEGVEASKRCGVPTMNPDIDEAIYKGTPLPKGHGKIADIDEILEEMKATKTYDIPFALGRVKPIIPADTESEEE